jgi:purine-nucleoside phosphorylase
VLTVLAIAAERFELMPWLRRCGAVESLPFALAGAWRAEWNGLTLFAAANGAGPRLAGQAVSALAAPLDRIDGVLSVGLCGALDPALTWNDLCTAAAVSDGDRSWPVLPLAWKHATRLLSTDRFFGQAAEKARAFALGFQTVDMEAAACAAWAAENKVPFYAAKVVSDVAADAFAIDFNAYRDEAGRFDRRRLAMAAMQHPIRYAPCLIRMARRGKAASEILGESLANYRF